MAADVQHVMCSGLDDDDKDGDEYQKVSLGVALDFTMEQQQRACSSPERQEKRDCLIDALERIVDDCPRKGTGRREWLAAALENLLQNGIPRRLDTAPSTSPNVSEQSKKNTLDIQLSSPYTLEVVSIGRVSEGPRIGQHALYVKTHCRFTRFLELPRELRDRIYCFAMTKTDKILLVNASHRQDDSSPTLTPGLLTVSKQVHEETLGVLYGENTFKLINITEDGLWRDLSEKGLRCIRRLEISLYIDDEDYLRALDDHLWKLPQLTSLGFHFDADDYKDFCRLLGGERFAWFLRRWFVEVARLRGDQFAGLKALSARFCVFEGYCAPANESKRVRKAMRKYVENATADWSGQSG